MGLVVLGAIGLYLLISITLVVLATKPTLSATALATSKAVRNDVLIGIGEDYRMAARKSAPLTHRLELQQLRRRQFQRCGQAADIDKRNIALPAFHPAQVAARHAGLQRQRLLRPAARLA